jgi:hypothetical protein
MGTLYVTESVLGQQAEAQWMRSVAPDKTSFCSWWGAALVSPVVSWPDVEVL